MTMLTAQHVTATLVDLYLITKKVECAEIVVA